MPHIADMKPGGKFHMRISTASAACRSILSPAGRGGLLHGDEITVTGKTMAENLAEIDPPAPEGTVVYPVSDPINAEGAAATRCCSARWRRWDR